jgi:hypothetical protein
MTLPKEPKVPVKEIEGGLSPNAVSLESQRMKAFLSGPGAAAAKPTQNSTSATSGVVEYMLLLMIKVDNDF